MTDDRDYETQRDRQGPVQGPDEESREEWTRERWKSLTANPDDETDLGYDIRNWEEFETLDRTDQVMFLPNDEEKLRKTAFLVVLEQSIVDLENHC